MKYLVGLVIGVVMLVVVSVVSHCRSEQPPTQEQTERSFSSTEEQRLTDVELKVMRLIDDEIPGILQRLDKCQLKKENE